MKAIKTILITTAFLLVISMDAQEKKAIFGIKAGMNLSDITSTEGGSFSNVSTKVGYNAGLTLDYAINSKWYLLSGLEYSLKGVKIDGTGITAGYIQLPACAGLKIPINDKNNDMSVLVHMGLYAAYGLNGKIGSSSLDTFSDIFAKKFDLGVKIGASLEWNKYSVGLAGEVGVINVMQAGNSKSNTRNYSIFIGYKFR